MKNIFSLVKRGLIKLGQRKEVYIMIDNSIKVNGNVEKSNLNTGEHVSQQVNINENQDQANRAFQEVLVDTKKIQDDTQRKMAEYMVEQLKEAYQDKNPDNAKQPFGFLRGMLGDIGSISSIASIFGFSLA
jgi:RecG-like helicase